MNPAPACGRSGSSASAVRSPLPELQPGPCVTAHPVAVILALLLLRARKAGAIRRAVATVFEPASEHGQRGMDELHQQTVNLLSFQPLPKDVFDVASCFQHGGALRSEVAAHARFRRGSHPSPLSAKLPAPTLLQPSVLLLQAPIFHGHALALYLEMDHPVDLPALSQALAGDHVAIPGAEDEAPSNVSSAGQADIQLSLKSDPAQPNGVWLWVAADNLRIAALTAVECAESMTATRPTGKIQ